MHWKHVEQLQLTTGRSASYRAAHGEGKDSMADGGGVGGTDGARTGVGGTGSLKTTGSGVVVHEGDWGLSTSSGKSGNVGGEYRGSHS